MEKLVEEIQTKIQQWAVVIDGNTKISKAVVKLLITLIGKAYADGELELLGEEARIKDCYVGECGEYRDIIVFRKEEKE